MIIMDVVIPYYVNKSIKYIFNSKEILLGYGLEDPLIIRSKSVELLISFYECASNEGGRGFLNAPSVEKAKSLSTEEIQKIIESGNKAINNLFESVIPENYINDPENYPNDVNNSMKILLEYMPTTEEMKKLALKHELLPTLNSKNPLLYQLLVWIIYNSGNSFVNIESNIFNKNNSILFIYLVSVYYIKYKDEKLMEYKKMKNNYNNVKYRVHGSRYGCWHSIMKNGILNMSNTKYMTCGAAYGSGVYLSPNINVSLGYCSSYKYTRPSLIGNNLTCMSIVETPCDNENDIYVVYLLYN